MGYSNYLYTMDKKLYNEIKSLSLKELCSRYAEDEEDEEFYLPDIPQKKLYDLGEIEYDDRVYSCGIPLFEDTEVMKALSIYKPYVVGKEGLLEIIKVYKEMTFNYYSKLKGDKDKQEEHIKDRLRKWQTNDVICLDENKECITTSWQREFAIFELVRLLKTIDFENNVLLFYGH